MTQQEMFNELCKHISREMLADMFKYKIRSKFIEPYATYYCNQVDDAKTFASILEYYANSR